MPDVTITLTEEQAQRVQAALATEDNPSPGIADVKVRLIDYLRAVVRRYESEQAAKATFDPT